MTAEIDWLDAFPIRPATEAVEALCESWHMLARLPGFHAGKREPELTRMLKTHIEGVTARSRGLLGMWAAENVINLIDPETAELKEERRTDIVYGWNDATTGIQLVFEFKKVDRRARSRQQYLGENGLGRFVNGMYSCKQAVAAMVGVLTDPAEKVVPALLKGLSDAGTVSALRLRPCASGRSYDQPSLLFAAADFDTEHERPPEMAPAHGTIRIAHLFLALERRAAS